MISIIDALFLTIVWSITDTKFLFLISNSIVSLFNKNLILNRWKRSRSIKSKQTKHFIKWICTLITSNISSRRSRFLLLSFIWTYFHKLLDKLLQQQENARWMKRNFPLKRIGKRRLEFERKTRNRKPYFSSCRIGRGKRFYDSKNR